MTGGVADALDTWNFRDVFEQQRKVGNLVGIAHRATVGVHVLAQQCHFFHALLGQASHFNQHLVKWAAEFFAAGIGHHAVAAVFATAFHDAHKSRCALNPRRRQVVELFNFGEADIDLRFGFGLAGLEQVGQAVQCLRAKHHVDKRRTLDDVFAFLAGHATAHANEHTFFLEVLDAA